MPIRRDFCEVDEQIPSLVCLRLMCSIFVCQM